MYNLDLENTQEPEIKLPVSVASYKKQRNFRKKKIYFFFVSLIVLKPLNMWIPTNCGKFLKRWEYQTTLPVCMLVAQSCPTHQAAPSMEFSRQEHRSGLLSPSPKGTIERKKESEFAQSCLTLCNPVDCSLPGSSIHGISRQEYWGGLPFSSPDHLTCLLRNLYASQEATGRSGHGTTEWFQIGKGVRQGCI